MKVTPRDHLWEATMGIFLHVVAVVSLTSAFWRHGGVISEGGSASAVLQWILSLDALQSIGLITLVLVGAADAISIYRLWIAKRTTTGADTKHGPALPTMGLHVISVEREMRQVGDAGVLEDYYASLEVDSNDASLESADDKSPVSATLRHALWAILGLSAIVVAGVILGFSHLFAGMLRTWPNEVTMGAVVIGMALILSVAILSSFLMLAARINAVSAMTSDAEEVRRRIERAKAHLAVIARHRDPLRSSG